MKERWTSSTRLTQIRYVYSRIYNATESESQVQFYAHTQSCKQMQNLKQNHRSEIGKDIK